jgi:Erythromycin esterase
MGDSGELNLGQLVREAYGTQARLIGFTTHTGTVTAESNWDEPAQRKRVRPSLAGSYQRLFHDVGIGQFQLRLADAATRDALSTPRLERAIGVIYRPDSERASHYFQARLPQQFDAILHIDDTHALEPLEAHDNVLPAAIRREFGSQFLPCLSAIGERSVGSATDAHGLVSHPLPPAASAIEMRSSSSCHRDREQRARVRRHSAPGSPGAWLARKPRPTGGFDHYL